MFAVIPEHVLYNSKLSPQARLLFGVLSTGNNSSFDRIAGELNVLGTTIQKWFKELENAGVAKYEETGKGRCVLITMDCEPFVAAETSKVKQRQQTLDKIIGAEEFTKFTDGLMKRYPRRNGRLQTKSQAVEWIRQHITEPQIDSVVLAVANYAASKPARDGYAVDPIRFFRNKLWLDYLEASEVQPVTLKPVL